MKVRKYRIKDTPVLGGAADSHSKQGDIVYGLNKYDYGLASDDTRATGFKHISVTLDPTGDYPSFTIPVHNLEELHDES